MCVKFCRLNRNITIFVINTLRPKQNGRRFADAIFKLIFLGENAAISLKFVPKSMIDNTPALVGIMAWFTDAYIRHWATVSFNPDMQAR